MPRDHFVPRHYLRQFSINGSEEIMAAKISPYRSMGKRGIGGVCQEMDFYEGDKELESLLWTSENDLAPVLCRIIQKEEFDQSELSALQLLATILNIRTKKATEACKVLPKRIIQEFHRAGINRGEIPPPPNGKPLEDVADFSGMSSLLIKSTALVCFLEMRTLDCKLLKTTAATKFITSDNPVVILNQFCAATNSPLSFEGFGRSGFQLLTPISPTLCVFFFDPKVYKVGFRQQHVVPIPTEDTEIINSLQIQSADEYIYFNDPNNESAVQKLIGTYSNLRRPIQDQLQTIESQNKSSELLHWKHFSAKLPKTWSFCKSLRHIKSSIGGRRDPAWSALIDKLMEDLEKNPDAGEIPERLIRLINEQVPKR